ncbi:hypothetical protein AMECASPLE_006521 [Ameca splendens]|uniref:Maturase K n=1 Tax=Ameca splendens TaxID=208324 RepID=A0ABV0ZJ80_9TELE
MPQCFCHDFESLSFGSMSLSFLDYVSETGSFLLSSSPEPSHKCTLSTLQRKPAHIELVYCNLNSTEQYQVNSLRIYLLKTWILNFIPPGDLTTIIHEIFHPFLTISSINNIYFTSSS